MSKRAFILLALGLAACDPVTHTLGVLSPPSGGAGSDAPIGGDTGSGGSFGVTGGDQPAAGSTPSTAGLGSTGGRPVSTGGTAANLSTGGQVSTDCGLVEAEPARAQIVMVLDTTFTIPVSFLNPIADGLRRFIQDPRSRGIDMGLYVLKSSCAADTYASPDVEVGQLPAHAVALADGIPNGQISYTQPMDAIRAATARIKDLSVSSKPQHRQAVAFVTDGVSGGLCNVMASELRDAIQEAQDGSPAVDTYILAITAVGFDASAWTSSEASPDQLASAGGTGAAYETKFGSGNSAEELNSSLQAVRADLQPCEIIIARAADADDLQVSLAGNGELAAVSNAAACGTDHGYYFKNATDLTQGAILCPASCQLVRDDGLQALAVGSRCP